MLNSNDDPDSLIRDLELGEEAHRFLTSTLGQFIVQEAEKEIREAVIELQVVDPTDERRIRELQNTIKVVRSIPEWLDEAIRRGEQAFAIARERN